MITLKLLQQKLIHQGSHYWLSLMRQMEILFNNYPIRNNTFSLIPVSVKTTSEIFSAVRNIAGQMAMIAINIETGRQRILVPFSYKPIAFTRVRGDHVVFTASYNGKDQVWAWNDATGELNLLAGHFTGSYEADLDIENGNLLYSRFTADGNAVVQGKNQPSPGCCYTLTG